MMKKITHSLFKKFLLILFCVSAQQLSAQVVVTATPNNGTCTADGKITVTATGTTDTKLYSYRSIHDSDTSWTSKPQVTNNIFSNLASDTYDVAVYDANGGPYVLRNIVVKNVYTPMVISTYTTPLSPITGCIDDGSVSVKITSGKSPYNYYLVGGPSTAAPILNTSTNTGTFYQLSTGTYHINITDACGNTISTKDTLVKSRDNLANRDLQIFDWIVAPSTSPTAPSLSWGTNLVVAGATNNIKLIATGNDTVFIRFTGNPIQNYMPLNYPMEMRIEYPSGSGMYASNWHKIMPGGYDTIPNYVLTTDPKSNKYRILVKNPCNPNDSVFSDEKTFPNPYIARSGACGPYVDRTGMPGYNDGPVTIKLTQATPPFATKTYTWDDNNDIYYLDITGLPLAGYTVTYTTRGGYTYQTNTASNNYLNIGGFPALSIGLSNHNYPASQSCDFTTAGLKAYGIADTITKTYTIEAPTSVVRSPITSKTDVSLWSDLPYGEYTIRIQYGNCGSTTKVVNLVQPYSGFQSSSSLRFESGTGCGKFRIIGKGWYLDPQGNVAAGVNDKYVAKVINTDNGNAINTALTQSNTEFTTGDLDPGNYRVAFINAANSSFICSYSDRYITIPTSAYTPLSIDASKTGGLVCSSGFGTMHVSTLGGSGQQPITYRIKHADSANYTPYQTSFDFPNSAPGNYMVEAKDPCGYIASQMINLKSGEALFDIVTTGSTCQGSDIILDLTITGNPTDILWTNPGGTQVQGAMDTIRNFSPANNGEYTVSFNSSGCIWRDSITLANKPKLEISFVTDTVSCQKVNLTTLVPTSGSLVGLTSLYYTNNYLRLANPSQVITGTYHIVDTNSFGCSDTSTINVTVNSIATETTIESRDTVVCTGTNVTLKAKAATGISITNPIIRWYADQTSTTVLHTDTIYPLGVLTTAVTNSTTYYMSVQGDNYCENLPGTRKAVKVTVNQTPTLNITAAKDTLCFGTAGTNNKGNNPFTLAVALTGVAFPVSSYAWYHPDGEININNTATDPWAQFEPEYAKINSAVPGSFAYAPRLGHKGETFPLILKVNTGACGMINDTVKLTVTPFLTQASITLVSQPEEPVEVCKDTVYQVKIKAEKNKLSNMIFTFDDKVNSDITVKEAYYNRYPIGVTDSIPLGNLTVDNYKYKWPLTGVTLLEGDSLLVTVKVAPECGFFSKSGYNLNLDIIGTCQDTIHLSQPTKDLRTIFDVAEDFGIEQHSFLNSNESTFRLNRHLLG